LKRLVSSVHLEKALKHWRKKRLLTKITAAVNKKIFTLLIRCPLLPMVFLLGYSVLKFVYYVNSMENPKISIDCLEREMAHELHELPRIIKKVVHRLHRFTQILAAKIREGTRMKEEERKLRSGLVLYMP